jgi:hypothetical protein
VTFLGKWKKRPVAKSATGRFFSPYPEVAGKVCIINVSIDRSDV